MSNNISNTVKCYSHFCRGQNNAFDPDGFNDVFPGIKACHEEDFFLVCNRYSITINLEQPEQDNLNIFERTVLKLLKLANFTDEELAAKMGVEEDFVNFIRLSLIERGYIDSENLLLKEIGNYCDKEAIINVFTLKNRDILLPIIIENDISFIDARKDKEKLHLVDSDSAGKAREVTYKYYSYDKNSNAKSGLSYPSNNSIISTIRDLCKWDKNIKLNCYSSANYEGDVFVHFKAVIQNNKADTILVSEGVSYTNYDVISFIREKDSKFFERTIHNAYQYIEREPKSNKKEYAFYPNLQKLLSDISLLEGQTVSERERAVNNYNGAIYKMYGALEWGFHYYLSQLNITPEYKKILCNKNRYQIRDIALASAKKMGFRNIEHFNESINLLSMTNGYSIKNYFEINYNKMNTDKFSPNLKILLPLCLIMADYTNDKTWYKIARKFPCLFGSDNKQKVIVENLDCNERISEEDIKEKQEKDISSVKLNLVHLYHLANKSRHGNKDGCDIDYILVNGLYKRLNELLKLLLPDYDMSLRDAFECNDIANNQLKDMIGLFKWFGNSDLHRFPYQMYQELYNISPGRDKDNNFNTNSFICSLYKVLEIYFKDKLYLLDIPVKSKKTKLEAISYIQMRLFGRNLPSYLKSVKNGYYKCALNNMSSSLGACALAWAGHVKDDKYTGSELMEILEIIGFVTDYRSHGNNISFDLTNNYLFQLRDNALSKIKEMEKHEYGK